MVEILERIMMLFISRKKEKYYEIYDYEFFPESQNVRVNAVFTFKYCYEECVERQEENEYS
jgi:hypothetical protein